MFHEKHGCYTSHHNNHSHIPSQGEGPMLKRCSRSQQSGYTFANYQFLYEVNHQNQESQVRVVRVSFEKQFTNLKSNLFEG